MLCELHIRNLGLIADVSVRLGPGLNVVTGETGVGKTLLVTSVSLLAGARGAARLVAQGADHAAVEAVVAPSESMRAWVRDRELEADDELVVVRRLSGDGRSRGWIGGQLVPLGALAELGELLVEIHGQGSGFALAKASAQLEAVDALAGNSDLLERYRTALAALRSLGKERDRLSTDERTRLRELDLCRHQADEISQAALEPGEDEAIAVELARLEHAERLGEIGAVATELVGSEGASGSLTEAHKTLDEAAALDPSASSLASRVAELATEAAEIARDVRAWSGGLEPDPARLDALQSRKALIASLKRKHGSAIEDVIAAGRDARARADELEQADARLEQLEADITESRAAVAAIALQLSRRRQKAGKQLSKLVGAELPALALPQARFEVSCETSDDLTDDGADRVEFLFSSVAARDTEPIGKIASGGELSRAMIAVTLALANKHAIPVLIFDEADQGVGGEAALELAKRLGRLGRSHQVLVVSHLPQIAAFADVHVAVRRKGTNVTVETLDSEGRRAEISRMLAGLESSDLARGHADELLELARSERANATAPPEVQAPRVATG